MGEIPVNISVDPADAPRLSAQSSQILSLLRSGPRTNVELSQIALKYTSRLSEVRQYLAATTGEQVEALRGSQGVWTYRLSPPAPGYAPKQEE